MKDLADKVAVVTGAASGIGLAMATRFAAERMKVVLADVEAAPLARVVDDLCAAGATVVGVPTDVGDAAAVDALAARALQAFGAVHVVCNNAGVSGPGGPLWTLTEADWEWTLRVNLWGVIHGIRAFVPHLVAQGEGHVVNTASMAGLLSPQLMGPYVATKHAVVALSEVLARDLQLAGSSVKVSALCPGFVRTRIAESARNRPAHLAGDAPHPMAAVAGQAVEEAVAGGIAPDVVAEQVVAAIREERFYVLTHPEMTGAIHHRNNDIVKGRYPTLP